MANLFIIHYRELRVYQMALETAMQVFDLVQAFPPEERERLTHPLIQATRSVCINVAQGWQRRRKQSAFVAYLNRAEAEAATVQVWLEFAVLCHYLDAERGQELHHDYQRVLADLNRLINHASAWTIPGDRPS